MMEGLKLVDQVVELSLTDKVEHLKTMEVQVDEHNFEDEVDLGSLKVEKKIE